ncbi:uncharacterized protein LOC123682212 isoform X5 [Harmonia axyridis]|uniref:uncharacterized protein LOC123682212 isoform X2 n=1 Tax=Harmonia axyridis TaxID=115357 RepID=UPI001E275364|nr:uncharacterized protein LOC123682212 isoform X2 [Harmonia axyridis]XP_045476687.1 uncharacterized protein LOC123682212 isoform X5 [Harmonia axyridis]
MRYLVLFLILFMIVCVLISTEVDAKKKKKDKDEKKEVKEVECIQCETADEDSSCRDGTVSKTCKGKYCFYYTYDERIRLALGGMRTKYWWMRGCTTKKKTCKKEGVRNCVVCNETRCNTEPLPTMYPVFSDEYFR